MPTFMDPRTGRIVREYDDEHEPMIDYADLRRRMLLAAVERLSSGNGAKDAAELDLMKSQAERNRADADATRLPKPTKFQEVKAARDEMRSDPEGAREEAQNPDEQVERVGRMQARAAGLQPGFDMARVGPMLEKAIGDETGPLAAAGDDTLEPVKAELIKAFWEKFDADGKYGQRRAYSVPLPLREDRDPPHIVPPAEQTRQARDRKIATDKFTMRMW